MRKLPLVLIGVGLASLTLGGGTATAIPPAKPAELRTMASPPPTIEAGATTEAPTPTTLDTMAGATTEDTVTTPATMVEAPTATTLGTMAGATTEATVTTPATMVEVPTATTGAVRLFDVGGRIGHSHPRRRTRTSCGRWRHRRPLRRRAPSGHVRSTPTNGSGASAWRPVNLCHDQTSTFPILSYVMVDDASAVPVLACWVWCAWTGSGADASPCCFSGRLPDS